MVEFICRYIKSFLSQEWWNGQIAEGCSGAKNIDLGIYRDFLYYVGNSLTVKMDWNNLVKFFEECLSLNVKNMAEHNVNDVYKILSVAYLSLEDFEKSSSYAERERLWI